MAGLEIGYNVNKAKDLMQNIADNYKELGNSISGEWDEIVRVLQEQWIGEDEQNFEAKFADRLCNLYKNAYELAKGCCETISDLTLAWHDFQASNNLDGSTDPNSAPLTVEIPDLSYEESIVSKKDATFSDDTNYGLSSSNSAGTIKQTVETYASNIKGAASRMFSEVSSDKAFFGDQSTTIDQFVEGVGNALGEVAAAVKDLHDTLDTLASQNYNESINTVKQTMTENKATIDNAVQDLGQSRWS